MYDCSYCCNYVLHWGGRGTIGKKNIAPRVTCIKVVAPFPEMMMAHGNIVVPRSMELRYQIQPNRHFMAAVVALHFWLHCWNNETASNNDWFVNQWNVWNEMFLWNEEWNEINKGMNWPIVRYCWVPVSYCSQVRPRYRVFSFGVP